jgi:hypothetical protein
MALLFVLPNRLFFRNWLLVFSVFIMNPDHDTNVSTDATHCLRVYLNISPTDTIMTAGARSGCSNSKDVYGRPTTIYGPQMHSRSLLSQPSKHEFLIYTALLTTEAPTT